MTSGTPSTRPDLQDLLSEEGLQNPTGFYDRWRAWEQENGPHPALVLSHAGISEVYADKEVIAARIGNVIASASPEGRARIEPVQDLLLSIIAFLDPPDHTRLRRLLSSAFTPKVIRHQEAAVQSIADRLVSSMETSGNTDLVEAVAYPMPSLVIGAMLGVPEADLANFGRWAMTIVEFVGAASPSDEQSTAIADALGQTREYLSGLAAKRRAMPTDDLFSSMLEVSTGDDDAGATDDELFANSLFLMTAGHETATNGITNGVMALLQHPEQRQLLAESPELIGGAVDEMLRFDSPIQVSARLCDRDRVIAGAERRAGKPLILVLGAGNHDPAVFTDPGRFDITRYEERHLSFGHGRHFCLGASLARSEMSVVIPALFERFPALELSDPDGIQWQPTLNFRGVRSLPVGW
jgi:cytochrome P450